MKKTSSKAVKSTKKSAAKTTVSTKVSKKPVKKLGAKTVAKKVISKTVVTQKTSPSFSSKPLQKKHSAWEWILGIANIVFAGAMIAVNYLAVSLPLGGKTTGELADMYPNLFVPAGITFSIWGLIYTLVIGFVVWQLVDLIRKNTQYITKKVGIWFLVSCVLNAAWIFAWHYQYVLYSLIIMVLMLITFIILVNKVKVGQKLATWKEKLLVQAPFSIYLGRISVATIANTTAVLVNIQWDALGIAPQLWTMGVIVVAAILALLGLIIKKDILYAGVVVRAFIGIILKRLATNPTEVVPMIWTLGICIAIIMFGIGLRFKDWRKN